MIRPNPLDAFELFLRARELSEPERDRLLEACAPHVREEVLSLLSHDRAPHPLVLGFDEPVEWSRAWSPDRVGGYEIAGRIGEGASGVVFEGVEPGLNRRVAIKALLPGKLSPPALRRFEREARVLAALDHPGIARILRTGTASEGRFTFPYIVMDLIEGLPLTRFVLRGGLVRPACLELMAKVCDAVQHAHQKGVIHRDLKPSNILVEPSGTPRILDFGIARLIYDERGEGATLTGEVLGTPPYLSPEQARGDWRRVDTRSDIYSLGVLLLEALTGERPAPPAGGVAAPIALARSLPGDLQAVILKATADEPEGRYTNASDFADDLRRAARKEPVLARRYNAWRRSVSFLRRHKALSAAAMALAFGGAVAGWQAHRAKENYRTLVGVLVYFCNERGAPLVDEPKRLEVVEQIRHIDLGGSEEEASVLFNIGGLMESKGVTPSAVAEELLRRAVAIREKERGPNDSGTLEGRLELAWALYRMRSFAEAESIARSVYERLKDDGARTRQRSDAQLLMAYSMQRQGRFADIIPLMKELIAQPNPGRLSAFYLLGSALMNTGHADEGIVYLRKLDGLLRETCDQPILFISNLCAMAAYSLRNEGDVGKAEQFLNEAAAVTAARDDLPDNDEVGSRIGLAGLAWAVGDLPLCEQFLRELIAKPPRKVGPESNALLECRNMLGVCLRDQRRWAEAEPLLRDVLKQRTEKAGPGDPTVANSMINLGQFLVYTGKAAEARELAELAKVLRLASYGPGSPEVLECDALFAESLVAEGKDKEGFALFDSLMSERGSLARGDWFTDAFAVPYAWSLTKSRGKEAAEQFLVQELETAKTQLGPKHLVTVRRQIRLERYRNGTSPALPASALDAAAQHP